MDFKKGFYKLSLKVIIVIFFINALAIIDSNIRTFQYKEKAGRYANWRQNPSEKEEFFEQEALRRKKKLNNLFKTKKISEKKYDLEMENLVFLKKFKIQESSAKYSFFWNKKADMTFTGPFIFRGQNLKDRTKKSKTIWVKELEKKKIKFKDYMVN
ncbi:MAG: hypothetical protein KAI33_00150 [Elusimicrobiales bacterium]|nr:hypothetical protein [Elusimicrobiales bacterium]MCK5582164.1 hypothetical protein [Elusimicrobiales bacterium]